MGRMRALVESGREARTKGSERCIVFLHLPKTAGSTLKAALQYKYPSETLLLEDTSDHFGGIDRVPLEERRSARVVTGHIHYGIHRLIPRECDYVTVLREPVARVVSMYRHILAHPRHRLHDQLAQSGMGLEEFARTADDAGLDNLQTRLISGRQAGEVITHAGSKGGVWLAPELGRDDLEEAKRNLDRFLVVGLTERFDESFILIRRALGWKLPVYETRNVAKVVEGSTVEPPKPEAIELIRDRNTLDIELYEHAQGLLSGAIERQGPSFQPEVAAFRLLNRIPDKLGPRIPAPLRHPLRSMLPR
jgi:hypothetical protein